MKKVLMLFGVVLFPAFAFALNAEAPSVADCQSQKKAFEEHAAGLRSDFVAQYILINMSDPMEQMSDEEALPVAACYANFTVQGRKLTSFVRAHSFFPGDIQGREKAKLETFATRVDRLSVQARLNKLSGNMSHVMQYVLINLADPMVKMSDAEAAPLAKAYQGCYVNGQPLMKFVRVHASEFPVTVAEELDTFVARVNELAN